MTESTATSFRALALPEPLLKALDEVGYETPSPIQAQAIPSLLAGRDLLGRAPTGTGKTAAFALPLLARIDLTQSHVQVMTLTPTRELAIQVAEAFQRYASHLPGFHVIPIYGGQDYAGQIRHLRRGVHVVVGTPGRVMDHMRKGRLVLDKLQALVLDEADEMLRMGFVDEVDWILEQTPKERQTALFSATMPKEVARIARRHLKDPQEIAIAQRTATADTIRQRYWLVGGLHKLDAFTRILEVEPFDAILVFVRTKMATTQLAERLEARGYAAAAMNGDMAQNHREQTVDRLKKGAIDILVATDVAARGLDVERISHVINYDIPYDSEAYIHRIGRTGRAGRTGEAILFVAPRERRMLGVIERATRQKIERLELPTTEVVNNKRIANFKQKISDTLAADELTLMRSLIEQYEREHNVPAYDIAAALASMALGGKPLLMDQDAERPAAPERESKPPAERGAKSHRERDAKPHRERGDRGERTERTERGERKRPGRPPEKNMERFRIDVGHRHGATPGNIVGAIANEAGLDSKNIGQIDIRDDFALVDLPMGMPGQIFKDLKNTRVRGQQLNITRMVAGADNKYERPAGPTGPKKHFDRKPKGKHGAGGAGKPKAAKGPVSGGKPKGGKFTGKPKAGKGAGAAGKPKAGKSAGTAGKSKPAKGDSVADKPAKKKGPGYAGQPSSMQNAKAAGKARKKR